MKIHRDGTRSTSLGKKQRWLCNDCNARFVLEPISKIKGNVEIVTLCMDLYFKGLSYRSIQDTLTQFKQVNVNHVTIMRWVTRYMEQIRAYVDTLNPQIGKIWHADEQMVNVKGKHEYVWNCMDSRTRFLLANRISPSRTTEDARKLFRQAKRRARSSGKYIITDGCFAYNSAVMKEFYNWSNKHPHKQYRTLHQGHGTNNKLERYHGSFRQREKSMRAFSRHATAQRYVSNYRTYYNFLRYHSKLKMTPAQKAGLRIPADWKEVLVKAVTSNGKS